MSLFFFLFLTFLHLAHSPCPLSSTHSKPNPLLNGPVNYKLLLMYTSTAMNKALPIMNVYRGQHKAQPKTLMLAYLDHTTTITDPSSMLLFFGIKTFSLPISKSKLSSLSKSGLSNNSNRNSLDKTNCWLEDKSLNVVENIPV